MVRRSKNLAEKPVADADLPHIEDVFDRQNWESRMVKARKARENVLTHLDEVGSDASKSRAKNKASANKTDEPAVSLKKVMETRNLKERLELAQKRHAQVQNKNRGDDTNSGFVYTRKSTEEFKKVVLNAKAVDPETVPSTAKSHADGGASARNNLPPLVQDAGADPDERPKKRAYLWFGLLLSGIAAVVASVVLIGGLLEQSGVVETASIAPPAAELISPAIALGGSYQPASLAVPSESENLLSGISRFAVTMSTAPDSIAYLGGTGSAPQAVAPLPVQSGSVQVTWNIGSEFLPAPTASQATFFLTAADYVRPNFQPTSDVGLTAPVTRPGALAWPLDYSRVSLSLIAPEIISPLIAEEFELVGFGGGTVDARLPNIAAAGELFASLDPSVVSHSDTAPAIDTVAPVAAVAPEILIGASMPAHNIRVFAPTDLSEQISGDVVARLSQAGFDVGSLKSVGIRISSNNVRYYHSADAKVASALADLISAKARDFTSFSPRPPLGTVELWLKGAATATVRRQTAQPRNSSNDAALQALRDRLAQRLRSGDHLGGG